jgi:VanZ family protein
MGFALVMALLPQPPQLPSYASDKVQHIMAFATLAALGWIAYPSASSIRLLAWLSAFGALIEAFQAIPSLNRDSDIVDWVADTCAAAVVLGAFYWWRKTAQKSGR